MESLRDDVSCTFFGRREEGERRGPSAHGNMCFPSTEMILPVHSPTVCKAYRLEAFSFQADEDDVRPFAIWVYD